MKKEFLQTDKKIDYRFKILYAIGMVLVVAGHCEDGGVSLFYDWFKPAVFHLGLFVFCSGYFYKEQVEKKPFQYIGKKIKTLIVPLYVWNFVYAGIVAVLSLKGFTIGAGITPYKLFVAPMTNGHQFMYNMAGWFVAPLFMVEVFHMLFRKAFSGWKASKLKETVLFAICLCFGFVGVYLASVGLNQGWWLVLTRMLYFMPFYAMGVFYKNVLEFYDKMRSSVYFEILFITELAITMIYQKIPLYIPSWCEGFTDGVVLPYVAGFLGIAFWLRIAKLIEPVAGKNKEINLIADNTYSIMIHQFMGFMVVKTFFAMVQRFTGFFADFDLARYKTDIWYYYLPNGTRQFLIVYLAAGIIVPILIQKMIDLIKLRIKNNK